MGGILQFSLGLATGGFLQSAKGATSAIGGMVRAGLGMPGIGAAIGGAAAGFMSLHAAVEKTFGAIEKGAALDALSRRTGESVKSLYQMQKGFQAVGLPAENVTSMIKRMQMALGGFNEFGEPTKDVFDAIGLSVGKLKGMDAPAQISTIVGQLSKLDRAEGMNIASKIFGREGGADAMQLSRSMEDFNTAMVKAAGTGALFGRTAAAFHHLEVTLEQLKGKANGFFAGIAEGAAPGLQAIVNFFNQIDITGLGQKIGQGIGVAVQAVKDGEFGELLFLGLAAGAEKGFRYLAALWGNGSFWTGLGEMALGAFGVLGTGLMKIFGDVAAFQGAIFSKTIQEVIEKFTGGKLRSMLGIPQDFQAQSFKEIFSANKALTDRLVNSAVGGNGALGAGFVQDGAGSVAQAIKEAMAAAGGGPMGEAFAAKFREVLAKVPVGKEALAENGDKLALAGQGGKHAKFKSDANELEKIGLLFSFGGRNAAENHQRRTADNTGKLVEKMDGLIRAVGGLGRTDGGVLKNA